MPDPRSAPGGEPASAGGAQHPEHPERRGTPVDGVHVVGALSPSRADDFRTCPLRYRFRTVDRLPEPPSPAAARGSLVHRVLEGIFDDPAPDRTPERAQALLEPAWAAQLEAEPELAAIFDDGLDPAQWLASAAEVLDRYFTLEDPRLLEPADRELYVETLLESRVLLRGVVDRVDVGPDGAVRIVDYKTGKAPPEGLEARALSQLRFYALVLWRNRGVVPAQLRLVYLGDGVVVGYAPDEADLRATQRLYEAVWDALALARETGDYQPNRGWACSYCSFTALCPAWGGTPPPLPEPEPTAAVSAD